MVYFVKGMPLLSLGSIDCNELVRVYLPTVDTQWWAMGWDRRDILLVWMGFWGWCMWWWLVTYSSCRSLVVDRRKWTWGGLVPRCYWCGVPRVGASGRYSVSFWDGAW